MGNSEVGHMNIGAGRIVWMDLPRIDRAIDSGAFANSATATGQDPDGADVSDTSGTAATSGGG